MRYSWIAIAPLLLTVLTGCGEGYRIVPARLNIVDVTPESFPATATTVHDFLLDEGFEDLGKYEEMIALIQHDNAMPAQMKRQQLARLEREQTFLNRNHYLRVVLSNFSSGVPPEMQLNYTRLSDHFVEVDVYDERPGGFGPYGSLFYERFLWVLRRAYGPSVRIVDRPPPENKAEYSRITTENTIAAVIAWGLAFLLPLAITGSVSRYLLGKLKIRPSLKRLIFVLTNTWLVAPLPFPAAFIFVMPAPNLFAFPWVSMEDYYSRVIPYAAVSFPVTLVLCTAISMLLFRKKADVEQSHNQEPASS